MTDRPARPWRHDRGLTAMELVVVTLIVAVLAAIAITTSMTAG